MAHLLTVVGLGMEVVGSAFLSFDLLKSKSAEEGLAAFRNLQAQVENESEKMIVSMNNGLWKLADLFGAFMAVLELDFEKKNPASPTANSVSTDPDLANIFERGRAAAVVELIDAKKHHLPSPEAIKGALTLVSMARLEIETQFRKQVEVSRRLRRVAIIGVLLVGVGGLCEFADLVLLPEPQLKAQTVQNVTVQSDPLTASKK
jgi:hypothetical protein